MTKRTRGFTLVELLVVVAIIALLVSILLPTLGKAKRITRETICGVHVRNLLLASTLYTVENDDFLPLVTLDPSTPGSAQTCYGYYIKGYWRDLFTTSYGIQRDNFYSPSNPKWNRDDFWGGSQIGSDDSCIIGYFYFGNDPGLNTQAFLDNMIAPPPGATLPLFATKMSDQPCYNWIWADLNRQWPPGPEDCWVSPGDPNRWGANHLYHDTNWPRGSHVGYLDGHVGWTNGSEIELRFIDIAEYYW